MRTTWRLRGINFGQATIEILLIVIGILIAFQIDRWKESRDKRQREIVTLAEIRESLQNDQRQLDLIADRYNTVILSLTILQKHQFQKGTYHDSLQRHTDKLIYGFRFQQRTTAFDNLKIVGIDLVTNDSLKTKLVELFDYSYPRQLRLIDFNSDENNTRPYFLDRINYRYEVNENNDITSIPILDESTFKDPNFLREITRSLENVRDVKRRFEILRNSVKELIADIETELKRLN